MKKLSILFRSVLALGMAVTSCSKDDSTTPTPTPAPAPFEGKWIFATIQPLDASGKPTGTASNFPGITGANDPTCNMNDAMTFNDGTAVDNAVYTDYPASGCTP